MGRTMHQPKPLSSGAVIFYGQSSRRNRSKHASSKLKPDRPRTEPSSPQNPSISASPTSTIAEFPSSDSFTGESSGTSLSSLSLAESVSNGSAPKNLLTLNNISTVIALLKTTADLFQNAPYIKAIAGVVQQIIQIADDIQTNKDRSLELIDKVASYAHVVFGALNNSHIRNKDGLNDLKDDLLHIGSVLQSIYTILQSLSVDTISARFSRAVHREEILSRIEEQDRRLDTAITSFQLKSSIVLRAYPVYMVPDEITQMQKPTHTRRFSKLRTKPQIMFGRDDEIERLVTMILDTKPARLAILGPGGMGKTSLALSVLHDERVRVRFGDDRLFVSCEAATCVDHVILDLAVSLQIATDTVNGDLLDAVLDCLRQSPFLVVLDNFETPWEQPTARSDVEAILQELTSVNDVSLVITMRGSQHPAGVQWSQLLPPLQPVDVEAATAIFQSISRKVDKHAIKLIQAVDRVPLAVTLLANLAAVDGETTEALWLRWSEENVVMVESGSDRLSNLDCSIQLSLSSPRMRRDPDALAFLSILSILPDGMSNETYHTFHTGIPSVSNVKKAVSTLKQNALIFLDTYGGIRVLSPIRLYISAHHAPAPEARRCLQDHFIDLAYQGTMYDDFAIKNILRSEAENIEAMLVDSLQFGRPLEMVVEAVLSFCHYTYVNGVGSSTGISLAVEMFKKKPVTHTEMQTIRKLHKRPAPRFRRFGGLHFWKEESKLSEALKVHKVDQGLKLHGDCLGCWGQLLSRQSRFADAQEKFNLAIQLHIQAGDISGHAYDLHNLGCLFLRDSTTLGEAQSRFLGARVLHEQINDSVGAAYDLMGSGQIHLQQSQFLEGKSTFIRALKLFIDCEDEHRQASTLNSIGQAALCGSKFKEAEEYFTQALDRNIKTGNDIGRAESLAGLAYTLLLRSRFPEARQRIEEAIALRSPAEDPDHLHILTRVFIAENKFDQAKRMVLKARELHHKIDDKLGAAEDEHYMAHISYYVGDMRRAIVRLEPLEDFYTLNKNILGRADVLATGGMALIRHYHPKNAHEKLTEALKLHKEVGSLLGQAFDLHHIGHLHLQRGEISNAIACLNEAFTLHSEVENVQGQADDLNKLAEASLRRQCYTEALTGVCQALALHIEIGDIAGQGDDLYVQGCIFLEQLRLREAEEVIRKAFELHSESGVHHGKARDMATLSSVLWQKFKHGGTPEDRAEALGTLDKAISVFIRFDIIGECSHCCCKRKEMLEDSPHASCEFVNHEELDAQLIS